ncbi:MAG: hypothetical protein IJ730_03155 [Alphaproteobacteria bacterium]|nr:hypothetical protein [Alphaproteobacteria bacterium]
MNIMNKKGNEEMKNKLFIERFEMAESSGKTLKELGINRDTYWAYKSSIEAGNELINFSDLIDEEDVEAVINCCRENNIKEFTIFSNSTGMIRSIMALEAQGCRLIGTTMINRDNPHYFDDKQIPTFKIEILD